MSVELGKTERLRGIITQLQKDNRESMDFLYTRVNKTLDQVSRSCIGCEHFDEDKELCRLANKRPPARVIAQGCEAHEDEIPF